MVVKKYKVVTEAKSVSPAMTREEAMATKAAIMKNGGARKGVKVTIKPASSSR